jgi:hypothetical protein
MHYCEVISRSHQMPKQSVTGNDSYANKEIGKSKPDFPFMFSYRYRSVGNLKVSPRSRGRRQLLCFEDLARVIAGVAAKQSRRSQMKNNLHDLKQAGADRARIGMAARRHTFEGAASPSTAEGKMRPAATHPRHPGIFHPRCFAQLSSSRPRASSAAPSLGDPYLGNVAPNETGCGRTARVSSRCRAGYH